MRGSRRKGRAAAVAVAAVAALAGGGVAVAAFGVSADAGTLTIETATLDAPTNLAASNDCKKNKRNRVVLTWTDSTSPAVTKYEIDRSDDGGVTYTELKRVNPGVETTNDATIADDTTYSYAIFALRNKWTGPDSNVVTITTLALGTCT